MRLESDCGALSQRFQSDYDFIASTLRFQSDCAVLAMHLRSDRATVPAPLRRLHHFYPSPLLVFTSLRFPCDHLGFRLLPFAFLCSPSLVLFCSAFECSLSLSFALIRCTVLPFLRLLALLLFTLLPSPLHSCTLFQTLTLSLE
jgi:hypothetical protein